MSDLISRQAAVGALIKYRDSLPKPVEDYCKGFNDGLSHAINHMDLVPSADRPTGHIVTNCVGTFYPTVWAECSECGKPIDSWDKFCRHCGAYMRGE